MGERAQLVSPGGSAYTVAAETGAVLTTGLMETVAAPKAAPGEEQLLAPTTPVKPIYLVGWTAQEHTATATARLEILDAQGGKMLIPISLLADESIREFPFGSRIPASETGIQVPGGGLWLVRVTGTASVTVYYES
jgi:hypothetical protein